MYLILPAGCLSLLAQIVERGDRCCNFDSVPWNGDPSTPLLLYLIFSWGDTTSRKRTESEMGTEKTALQTIH
jgi:hypothetical protein